MSMLRISDQALRCPVGPIPIRARMRWALLVWLCALPLLAWADPVLPHIIGDHMVLQRERPIHIWGNADPKEKITVEVAGKTSATEADADGHWSVELPSMRAGGPFTLVVHGKKDIVLRDVMIGEVWVASGQSNMTFALNDATGGTEEVTKADYPDIRLFTVPKKPSGEPQPDTLPANWQICTPQAAKEFSAVAYYFSRDLHRKLNVPIGIVESAWPGTMIEHWMEPAALRRVQAAFGGSADQSPSNVSRQPFDLEFDDFQLVRGSDEAQAEPFSDFDDGTSRNSLGGYWAYDWEGAPQTSFTLISPGRDGAGYAAKVAGAIGSSDGSRLIARFHVDNLPADLSSYSGFRFWVRGNGSFRVRTLQPTITDWDDYSSSVVKATNEWRPVVIRFSDLRQEGWGVVKELTPASLSGFVIESMPEAGFPSLNASELYNGMITPIMPYGFRGVIWYQGESNALDAFRYRQILPAFIQSWRAAANAKFAFLIVQLPNHGAVPEQPGESAWAELREAEFLTSREVPDAGLAVTIDVGDPNDVHPHRKAEVGERLALWALGKIYREKVVYSGPLYQSATVQGNKISVRFSNIGGGLVAKNGGPLAGFAIAGADRKFYWADAVIQGTAVIVFSSQVPHPVAVRYAWGDSPICNLFNKEGLPASPFRTDEWPGITTPKIAAGSH
jgi:sialate O-acetylesterase